MNTFLWILVGLMAYLALAGWVHFDTKPPIHDDSRLRRTTKLLIMLPLWLVLIAIFMIMVLIGEYVEYMRGRKNLSKTPYDVARLEGNFK